MIAVDTLKVMYDRYGFENAVGIAYFNNFLDELKKYRFAEIFVMQAKTYPLHYVFEFLLSTPSLWVHLSALEWLEIINSMNPRPYALKLSLDTGYFADLHFLAKYIRVNSIEFFLRQPSFSNSDKTNVIRYCQRDPYALLLDEIDLEDLDGDYFVSEEEIKNVQSNLIYDGLFGDFYFNEDGLIDFLNKEKMRYVND